MEIMRLEKQFLENEKNDDLEKSTLIQSYKNRIIVSRCLKKCIWC